MNLLEHYVTNITHEEAIKDNTEGVKRNYE